MWQAPRWGRMEFQSHNQTSVAVTLKEVTPEASHSRAYQTIAARKIFPGLILIDGATVRQVSGRMGARQRPKAATLAGTMGGRLRHKAEAATELERVRETRRAPQGSVSELSQSHLCPVWISSPARRRERRKRGEKGCDRWQSECPARLIDFLNE